MVLPVLDPALVPATLEGLDGLLVTGGGDIEPSRYRQPRMPEVDGVDPDRDDFELALVRAALELGLPILGVGRGHQLVNVALGGTLVQHVPALTTAEHDRSDALDEAVHGVRLATGSLLAAVVGSTTLAVNSDHHQAVELTGAGLQVVARSDDGLIEGVEGLGDLEGPGGAVAARAPASRPGPGCAVRLAGPGGRGAAGGRPDRAGGPRRGRAPPGFPGRTRGRLRAPRPSVQDGGGGRRTVVGTRHEGDR